MSIYSSTILTMDPVHAVLIVLVLVLILVVSKDQLMGLCNKKGKKEAKSKQEWQCKNKKTGDLLDVEMELEKAKPVNLETKAKEAMSENHEYFQTCKDADETSKVLDCACDDSTGFPFSKDEYGAPGLDYNSYVMSQAVDNQVVKNHGEWIKDRKNLNNKGTEFTGRTYAPSQEAPRGDADGLGYAASSWVGIRGAPFKVPVCNPTTVQGDEDTDGFRTKRYCF